MSSHNICTLASSPLISTDEDAGSEKMLELTREPLLAVLDDKNKIINDLIRQNENQKMQLSYYLKKEFGSHRIEELSHSCAPQACEVSLAVNLALNKFCRQTGFKTKLSRLHERMNQLDYQLASSLGEQEFVLRKIVNNLCEHVRQQIANGEKPLRQYLTPFQVDLLQKLLDATVSLKRTLNSFRICCDRLVIVEEERNNVAEQVYSMPVEQRANCNYLLGIEMEKSELEKEIKKISRHRVATEEKIEEPGLFEGILCNLQWSLKDPLQDKNEENRIGEMLRQINLEAQVLLETSRRRRSDLETSKAKLPDLEQVLFYLRIAVDCEERSDEKGLREKGILTDAEIGLCKALSEELKKISNRARQMANEEWQPKIEECESLRKRLRQFTTENERLRSHVIELERDLEEMRFHRGNSLRRLKEERDVYKSQVEDLQTIREAYAQLLDKQPTVSKMEEYRKEIKKRDQRIFDLEREVRQLRREADMLRKHMSERDDRIDGSLIENQDCKLKKQPSISPNIRFSKNLPKKNVGKGFAKAAARNLAPERFQPSNRESLTCYKMYSQSIDGNYDLMSAVFSANKTALGDNVHTKGSSTVRVVYQYRTGDMDECEMFRDCSNESLIIWGSQA